MRCPAPPRDSSSARPTGVEHSGSGRASRRDESHLPASVPRGDEAAGGQLHTGGHRRTYPFVRHRPDPARKGIPSEDAKNRLRDLSPALDALGRLHAEMPKYAKTASDDLRSHYLERQRSDAYRWLLLISTHEQRHILADPRHQSESEISEEMTARRGQLSNTTIWCPLTTGTVTRA
jgi:hypothetical protein